MSVTNQGADRQRGRGPTDEAEQRDEAELASEQEANRERERAPKWPRSNATNRSMERHGELTKIEQQAARSRASPEQGDHENDVTPTRAGGSRHPRRGVIEAAAPSKKRGGRSRRRRTRRSETRRENGESS